MTRSAIITGGGSGIGKSIAARLLDDGFNCVLVGRNQERLQTALSELESLRQMAEQKILAITCDVTVPRLVEDMIARVKREFGGVSVLVNCAGRSGGGVTKTLTDELWLDVINTNLNSVFFVTREVLNSGAMQSGGSIINVSSTGGKQGVAHGAPYSASKHGVVGFTKALGLELAWDKADITVNAVCPGFVETEMAAKVRANYAGLWNVTPEAAKKRIELRVPIGRYIEPDEVAAMVSYLASNKARGVTAQALNVCGGLGNY